MATQAKPSEFWTLIVGFAALALGVCLLVMIWWRQPAPRGRLLLIEQAGPMMVDMPLVRYGGQGRHSNGGTYRTQEIRLFAAGQNSGIYRPARNLWIDDLDRVRNGQKVRFLVDPGRQLIYEAASDGRTLLTYDETAAKLSESTRPALLFALVFLLVGSFWVVPILRRRHVGTGDQGS